MSNPEGKKKVGRPPRRDKTDHLVDHKGIVSYPDDDNHSVEILITKPVIFKKLLALYHEYDATIIRIEYTKSEMIMSHYSGDKKLVTVIEGKNCNKYYCRENLSMYVECESLLKINSYIEPEYDYEFIWAVSGDISISNRKQINLFIMNKSNTETETIEINEVDPFNRAIGPVFNKEELTWPIGIQCASKSYKRKFTGIVKHFNHEIKIISDPAVMKINIISQDRGRKTTYELVAANIADPKYNKSLLAVFVSVKPLRLYLKNSVDENTKMYVSDDGIVCLSAELGKVKNKGTVIGSTKIYCWPSKEVINQFIPKDDFDYVAEPVKNKPKKKNKQNVPKNDSDDDMNDEEIDDDDAYWEG